MCYDGHVEVIVRMVEGVGGAADVEHSDQGKGDQTNVDGFVSYLGTDPNMTPSLFLRKTERELLHGSDGKSAHYCEFSTSRHLKLKEYPDW